jgi:two-component system response regulator FixJ
MNPVPTVFVIDDDEGVRRSLESLGKSADLPVQAFADGHDFLKVCRPETPGCLVLDVRLRNSNGVDLIADFRERGLMLPIIVITAYGDVPTATRAFRGGALDFLEKPVSPRRLIERIREALEIDGRQREAAAKGAAVEQRLASLTKRERDVHDLLLQGRSSKQIAETLDLSVRTVEGYRREVFRKMQVASAAELIRSHFLAHTAVAGTA